MPSAVMLPRPRCDNDVVVSQQLYEEASGRATHLDSRLVHSWSTSSPKAIVDVYLVVWAHSRAADVTLLRPRKRLAKEDGAPLDPEAESILAQQLGAASS